MKKEIKVIGIGGSGCSIVRNLENNYKFKDNVKIIGSDSATCGMRDCKNKLPLERVYPIYCKVKGILEKGDTEMGEIMCCIGCNGNKTLGEYSAYYTYEKIKKELVGVKKLILTTVLGGGTGSGAIKKFIDIGQELGIDISCIVSMPPKFESKVRLQSAEETLLELKKMNIEVIEYDVLDNQTKNIKEFFYNIDKKMSEKIIDTFLSNYIINEENENGE